MRWGLAAGVCLAILAPALGAAIAASARPTTYLLPAQMRAVLEQRGFTVSEQHILVGSAACSGLRRYGVKGRTFGGFSCRTTARDGSVYLLRAVPVTATRFAVTRFVIVSTADESVANCLDFSGTATACIKQLSG